MTRLIDLTEKTFERLTVIGRAENDSRGGSRWKCECNCGEIIIVHGSSLRKKLTKSCGCIRREVTIERNKTHGMRYSSEYNIWTMMVKRCNNSNYHQFENYGGRGIAVCESWKEFENFYEDMGPRPSDLHSINRIDNDGNYEPSNCNWATATDQARNKRNNTIKSIDDANDIRKLYKTGRYTQQELADIYKCSHFTIYNIVHNRQWNN